MPEAPRRSAATEATVCASMLGLTAGTYFIVSEFTDLTPFAAMLTALVVGSFGCVGLALVWIKLRLYFLARSPAAREYRADFMAQAEADRKELGLDTETKAFAEKDVQEFARKLRELELAQQYIKASESERNRLMKEVADKHLKESEAKVHEEAARATERIEALREYRALEQRARAGNALSPEERARMHGLRKKAYSG